MRPGFAGCDCIERRRRRARRPRRRHSSVLPELPPEKAGDGGYARHATAPRSNDLAMFAPLTLRPPPSEPNRHEREALPTRFRRALQALQPLGTAEHLVREPVKSCGESRSLRLSVVFATRFPHEGLLILKRQTATGTDRTWRRSACNWKVTVS